jgi:hypothetical protein
MAASSRRWRGSCPATPSRSETPERRGRIS